MLTIFVIIIVVNYVLSFNSNGVGRSGTFCAIASSLERVKQEHVLDVFQTVKNIRVNRPGAVQTLVGIKENTS
jgi:protein tyrosine phosphatase